ncbi:MAG: GGDEF domain-containing response regulator [Nitrospirae bacterium]|nr:MAG: GGDEF domain-containing response regulator [Nitrospirota bacterium]
MELITIVSDEDDTNKTLAEFLEGFNINFIKNKTEIIDSIYNNPPTLIIFNGGLKYRDYIRTIRDDQVFSHLPIILLLDEREFVKQWKELPADDFITKPLQREEFIMRLYLSIERSRRVVEVNPLTMLPGNTPIIKEVQARLDREEEFALAYADLDNFKPFNDKYGFSRGDEVIKMTGRLITNTVKLYDPHNFFVGHIGGDDFVYITSIERVEQTSREIIENFDEIIPSFYDPEDRERGYIISFGRDRKERHYPLLTLSIGITLNRAWFRHYGEISSAATEVKSYAKSFEGSNYFIDRRRYSRD